MSRCCSCSLLSERVLDAVGSRPYYAGVDVLTAAAAGLAPLHPPAAWFETPEAREGTPLTVTSEGHVYGHIALWDSCYVYSGRAGVCMTPPPSPSKYKYFHLGEVQCDDDSRVACGQITFDANHAPLSMNPDGTRDHYANTGLVGADIRATDGRLGIWVCGAVRPNLTPEQARALAASKPSGDWRTLRRGDPLELMHVLAVNIPGYPVPRTKALVAAGVMEGESRLALVACAAIEPPDLQDRIDVLAARFEPDPVAALAELVGA